MDILKIATWTVVCIIVGGFMFMVFYTTYTNMPEDTKATTDCLNTKAAEYCAKNNCEVRQKIALTGWGYTSAEVFDYKTYEKRIISLPLQDMKNCGIKVD